MGETIPAATAVWAADNQASAGGRWLGVETHRVRRVAVVDDLSVSGRREIFGIGDAAQLRGRNDELMPGTARVIQSRRPCRALPGPFPYGDTTVWATIGRNAAVISWNGL